MLQVARPSIDVTTAGWSKTPSSAVDYSSTLRELAIVPNSLKDATKVTSPTDPVDSVFETQVSKLAWPKTGSQTMRVRLRKTDSADLYALVSLMQGSQIIATRAPLVSETLTTIEYELTPTEVARITDYTDLRLRVTAGVSIVTDCEACPLVPAQWKVTLAGIQNTLNCSDCINFNGTHLLSYDGGCSWSKALGTFCDHSDWVLNLTKYGSSFWQFCLRSPNENYGIFWQLGIDAFQCFGPNEFLFSSIGSWNLCAYPSEASVLLTAH